MEIFNIGPLELIIVLVIMFVLLGPEEMKRTARRIAVSIRGLVRSPFWRDITGMSEEIRELPKRLMEDTGLEEAVQEVKETTRAVTAETNAAVADANAAMKESIEAARVPEAEHVRVFNSPDPGNTILPPQPSNGANAGAETAVSEVEIVSSPVDTVQDKDQPAGGATVYEEPIILKDETNEPNAP